MQIGIVPLPPRKSQEHGMSPERETEELWLIGVFFFFLKTD